MPIVSRISLNSIVSLAFCYIALGSFLLSHPYIHFRMYHLYTSLFIYISQYIPSFCAFTILSFLASTFAREPTGCVQAYPTSRPLRDIVSVKIQIVLLTYDDGPTEYRNSNRERSPIGTYIIYTRIYIYMYIFAPYLYTMF